MDENLNGRLHASLTKDIQNKDTNHFQSGLNMQHILSASSENINGNHRNNDSKLRSIERKRRFREQANKKNPTVKWIESMNWRNLWNEQTLKSNVLHFQRQSWMDNNGILYYVCIVGSATFENEYSIYIFFHFKNTLCEFQAYLASELRLRAMCVTMQ